MKIVSNEFMAAARELVAAYRQAADFDAAYRQACQRRDAAEAALPRPDRESLRRYDLAPERFLGDLARGRARPYPRALAEAIDIEYEIGREATAARLRFALAYKLRAALIAGDFERACDFEDALERAINETETEAP